MNVEKKLKMSKNQQENNMNEKLIERINQFNKIKYGANDNETRIIFATLKPLETVTTAPKYKE